MAINATIATVFETVYPQLTETDIGLCYLSMGGGSLMSVIVSGKLLDWQYQIYKRKYARSLGAEMKELEDDRNLREDDNFPIEKARLNLQFYFLTFYAATVIAYGWILRAKASLAAALVFQFLGRICL